MLNSISWQQYIAAVLLLSAAWYAYVGLHYFQPEISAFLKIKKPKASAVPAVANQTNTVMGSIQADSDTGAYQSDELVFSNAHPDDVSEETLPKGPSDDLLAEAQVLVTAYEGNDNKTEFLSLLQQLVNSYEVFRDEISLPRVIESLKQFAQAKLPFRLNDTEWPLNF
ncbi:hypothetical protein [Mucilaginibacter sp. 3215]|uniref:hypothetical protein n=1 Tax=Mucilaginibacter sp. 3215 TaxID=3373912 RepID=UPI003D257F3D